MDNESIERDSSQDSADYIAKLSDRLRKADVRMQDFLKIEAMTKQLLHQAEERAAQEAQAAMKHPESSEEYGVHRQKLDHYNDQISVWVKHLAWCAEQTSLLRKYKSELSERLKKAGALDEESS